MCRNIRVLHHFEPPTTKDEMAVASLQYVRKISGTTKPSAADQAAFDRAVAEVTAATEKLLKVLHAKGPPRTREGEKLKAVARWASREARIKGTASGGS